MHAADLIGAAALEMQSMIKENNMICPLTILDPFSLARMSFVSSSPSFVRLRYLVIVIKTMEEGGVRDSCRLGACLSTMGTSQSHWSMSYGDKLLSKVEIYILTMPQAGSTREIKKRRRKTWNEYRVVMV